MYMDFNFCKNYYDYKYDELYIYDFNSVITKSCFFITKSFFILNNNVILKLQKIKNKIIKNIKKKDLIYM